MAGYVADKWGRKTSMAMNTVPNVLGYFVIVLSYLVKNPVAFKSMLIAGRGITGIGMGWSIIIAPVSYS